MPNKPPKFSPQMVDIIRATYAAGGHSHGSLARLYGVSQGVIARALSGTRRLDLPPSRVKGAVMASRAARKASRPPQVVVSRLTGITRPTGVSKPPLVPTFRWTETARPEGFRPPYRPGIDPKPDWLLQIGKQQRRAA